MEMATAEQTAELLRLLALQLGAVSGKGEFEGYACLWGQVDRYDSIMAKGAFDDVLAEAAKTGLYPPLVWEHNGADVIGSVRLEVDDKGLRVLGTINLADDRGKWAYETIQKSQFFLSFWAGADPAGKLTDAEGHVVYTKMLYVRDISITADPGMQLATIDVVRNRHRAEVEAARNEGYQRGLIEGRAAAEAEHSTAEIVAAVKGLAKSI